MLVIERHLLRAAASSWCWTTPASRCSRARRSALVGRNGAASHRCSPLTAALQSDGGEADAAALAAARRHGRGGAGDARRLAKATDFVLAGDKPLRPAGALAAAERPDDGHAIAEAHQAIQDAGGFDARRARRPC